MVTQLVSGWLGFKPRQLGSRACVLSWWGKGETSGRVSVSHTGWPGSNLVQCLSHLLDSELYKSRDHVFLVLC